MNVWKNLLVEVNHKLKAYLMGILFLLSSPDVAFSNCQKESPHCDGKAVSMKPCIDFQVYSFQRKTLQVSGVWERILSV